MDNAASGFSRRVGRWNPVEMVVGPSVWSWAWCFCGSFSAAEANSLFAGQEGRMLLVLSHLIPEMDADPSVRI